jgi:GT2 family glycosyltransferase/glycosyltransferase involved in cell wall biosynthesis
VAKPANFLAGSFWPWYQRTLRAAEILSDDGALELAKKARTLVGRLLRGEENVVRWLCPGAETGHKLDDVVWATEIQPLSLPKAINPAASIIIPVFNQKLHTFNCLKSVLENTVGADYEVIVVDDASTDDSVAMLSEIDNLKIVRNRVNSGFLNACHVGARHATGRYLLFLNNDTQVRRGWLAALADVMENDASVGLVGAKLIYPDGRLQEAGGIIWKDASGCNYGRGDDPEKSEYGFVREVDYCSGACIMVRRELWERFGGFDARYAPAYYEDTDLAFTLREAGYKIVYQPAAEVIHHEGVSNGTELSEGVKKFQAINREKFRTKWSRVLAENHTDANCELLLARQRGQRKRVLVIDHQVPAHDRDSGSQRMYQMLRLLTEMGWLATFLPADMARREPYTTELQQMGIEVLYWPCRRWKFISKLAPYLDLVIVSRPAPGKKYLGRLRKLAPRAKFIYDTVDLYFLRESRRADLEKSTIRQETAKKYKWLEFSLAAQSDATFVVSPVEKEVLLEHSPALNVHVIPNIHGVASDVKPFAGRKDLLFVGAFQHPPNADGICYFVREVFPLVLRNLPGVKLYIVGSDPTPSVKALVNSNVIVTGWVKDIGVFFESARVFVAPLRYGAGVKGKIGQSLAYGLPVVTTSIGAEGMSLVEGRDVLIGDTPEQFAKHVVQVYSDQLLWQDLSQSSMEYIESRCTPGIVKMKLETVFSELFVPAANTVSPVGAALSRS